MTHLIADSLLSNQQKLVCKNSKSFSIFHLIVSDFVSDHSAANFFTNSISRNCVVVVLNGTVDKGKLAGRHFSADN